MKFWKQILLTTLAFFSIVSTTLYISCEKDQCSALQCQNGGTCVAGLCQCATGYEGTSCEIRSVDRYLGTYYGVTTDHGTSTVAGFNLLDTVVVFPGSDLVTVGVTSRAYFVDTFYGTIKAGQGLYHIVVQPYTATNYTKSLSIDLYDNIDTFGHKKLIVNKTVQTDTIAIYQFIGKNTPY